jgi:hypothetical protein
MPYDEAFGYCAANALEPTAQNYMACLTVVLRGVVAVPANQ